MRKIVKLRGCGDLDFCAGCGKAEPVTDCLDKTIDLVNSGFNINRLTEELKGKVFKRVADRSRESERDPV